MFGGAKICALLALVLLCSNASAALDMNHICLLLENGVLIASGDSCTTYYQCLSGIATLQTCPIGSYFDKNQQSCVDQAQSSCVTPGLDPCAGHRVGTWTSVPGSCSGYYYCAASGAERSNCPDGQNFNPNAQACSYPSVYPCADNSSPGGSGTGDSGVAPTTINLCTYVKNGIYFGSASSCSGWLYCNNNVIKSGNCQNGMMFNTVTAMCDYSVNVNCSQVTFDPNLSGTSPSNGGPCSVIYTSKAASACNQYYYCNGASYVLMQCEPGQYYDTVSETCVNRLEARNDCDRCIGTTKSFVNSYSTKNCAGYLYCENGVAQSSNSCPTGAYFNEVAGACVIGDDPDFGCCNPSEYYGTTTPSPSSSSSGTSGTGTGATGTGATGTGATGTGATGTGATGTGATGTGATGTGATGTGATGTGATGTGATGTGATGTGATGTGATGTGATGTGATGTGATGTGATGTGATGTGATGTGATGTGATGTGAGTGTTG